MLLKNEFHPILKEFRLEFKHEKAHAQFMPYSKMTPANHIVRHFSSLLLQAVGRKKKKTLIPTLMLICSDLVFVSENIYKLRYSKRTSHTN